MHQYELVTLGRKEFTIHVDVYNEFCKMGYLILIKGFYLRNVRNLVINFYPAYILVPFIIDRLSGIYFLVFVIYFPLLS